MMKYVGILLVFIILFPAVLAVEEEKIIGVDVGFTVEKVVDENNYTTVKVRAESDQNSYEFTLDKDTDSLSENKTFMTIKKLQCETEGILNLTTTLAEMNSKLYNEQCADVDGISYKWRWEGVVENYRKCEDESLNCTGELDNCKSQLSDSKSEINNKVSAMTSLQAEKQDLSSKTIWYFIAGALLISVVWYFKTKKDKPDQGPVKEGFTPFKS